MENYGVDLTKLPKKETVKSEEDSGLGLAGTFRKLNVD